MGSLEIFFNGICTWIPAWAVRDLGVTMADDMAWRVVLVSGINGMAHYHPKDATWETIPPHDATIRIGGNPINTMGGPIGAIRQVTAGTWALRGVKFTVANLVADQPKPLQSPMDDIPSLKAYASDMGPPPPLFLNPAVVAGQRASALFDISLGVLHPEYLGDPANEVARVRYTCDTDGPPRLATESFYDRTTSWIQFANDIVSISLDNDGVDTDTWWDFMLHYITCTEVPPNAYPPGPPALGHVDGLTAGCSDSQWP
jgi:hypothetical protein